MATPELLNTAVEVKVAEYTGIDDRYPVENVLHANSKFHCSKPGKGFDLLLELSESCTVTHFVARGPDNCTEPIKIGAVWFSSDKPSDLSYSSGVEEKETKEGVYECAEKKPDLVFETDGVFYESADELYPPKQGVKYVHIKYVNTHGDGDNVDVTFFGLVGFKGSVKTAKKFGRECLEDLNADENMVVHPRPRAGQATDLSSKGYCFDHMWYKPCALLLLPVGGDPTEHNNLISTLHSVASKVGGGESFNVFFMPASFDNLDKYGGGRIFGREQESDVTSPVLFFLDKDRRRYMLDSDQPFTVDTVSQFVTSAYEDETPRHIKSRPEPEDDSDPSHVGMTVVVGTSFDRIVLDAETDVFLDVWAPWCGPCVAAAPTWSALAETLHAVGALGQGKLLIAKCDCNDNDTNKEYITEGGIPNFKLFPKGDRQTKKDKAVRYQGDRSLKSFIEFVHEHMSEPKFDLPAALDKALDSIRKLNALKEASSVLQKFKRTLILPADDSLPAELAAARQLVADKHETLDGVRQREHVTAEELETAVKGLKEAVEASKFEEHHDKWLNKNAKSLKTQEEYESATAKGDSLTVVDFWAPWCGPCVNIAPFYGELSEKYGGVKFFKVECDGSDWIDELDFSSIPTFFFFKNGERVDQISGADKTQLEETIIKHM
eukprot:GDKI01003489.1.p1 GENE.GDKI01003489.1~~GDKI01003489.1.p1  ORF type:complete len:663 (-),score=239.83 GDKI01003489.1:357-2345(-)